MSKQKAKEFLEYLTDNPEVAEKMSGFTLDELKEAVDELIKKGDYHDWDHFMQGGDAY